MFALVHAVPQPPSPPPPARTTIAAWMQLGGTNFGRRG